MKIRIMIATLLTISAAVWGACSLAYHQGFQQGYSLGSRDESARWKLEPVTISDSWDGTVVGRRSPEASGTVKFCYFGSPVNALAPVFPPDNR